LSSSKSTTASIPARVNVAGVSAGAMMALLREHREARRGRHRLPEAGVPALTDPLGVGHDHALGSVPDSAEHQEKRRVAVSLEGGWSEHAIGPHDAVDGQFPVLDRRSRRWGRGGESPQPARASSAIASAIRRIFTAS
jgi:hypothetical protein